MTSDLPVIQKAYDFLLWTVGHTVKFPPGLVEPALQAEKANRAVVSPEWHPCLTPAWRTIPEHANSLPALGELLP